MAIMENIEKVHQGQNIRRFREMNDLKQDALASALGGDWTQRKVSLLEQKETVEPEILEHVAKVLEVSVSTIKKFSPKELGNHFNNYGDHYVNQQNHCTFNPLDELLKMVKKNEELYEQLLQSEREKIELLKGSRS